MANIKQQLNTISNIKICHEEIKKLEIERKLYYVESEDVKKQLEQVEASLKAELNYLSNTKPPVMSELFRQNTTPQNIKNRFGTKTTISEAMKKELQNASRDMANFNLMNKKIDQIAPHKTTKKINEAAAKMESTRKWTQAKAAKHLVENIGLWEKPKTMPTFLDVWGVETDPKIKHKLNIDKFEPKSPILDNMKANIKQLKKRLAETEKELEKNTKATKEQFTNRDTLIKDVLKNSVELQPIGFTFVSGNYDKAIKYLDEYCNILSSSYENDSTASTTRSHNESIDSDSSESESIDSESSESESIDSNMRAVPVENKRLKYARTKGNEKTKSLQEFANDLLNDVNKDIDDVAEESLRRTGDRTLAPESIREQIIEHPASSITQPKLSKKQKALLSEQKTFENLSTEAKKLLIEQRAFLLKLDAFMRVNDITKIKNQEPEPLYYIFSQYYKQVQKNIDNSLRNNKDMDPKILERIKNDMNDLNTKVKNRAWWNSIYNSSETITKGMNLSKHNILGKILIGNIVVFSITRSFFDNLKTSKLTSNVLDKFYHVISNKPKSEDVNTQSIFTTAFTTASKAISFIATTLVLKAYHDATAYDYDEIAESEKLFKEMGVSAFEVLNDHDAKFQLGLFTPLDKMHSTHKILSWINNNSAKVISKSL